MLVKKPTEMVADGTNGYVILLLMISQYAQRITELRILG